MRTFFIIILFILAVIIAAVFIYRYQIFQYSAEAVIRKMLPDYIRIDKITFDLKNSRIVLGDFKVLNPDGYSNRYSVQVENITCGYKMKGKSLLEGFEALEPSLKRVTINIERLADGRLNLTEMKTAQGEADKTQSSNQPKTQATASKLAGDRKLSDIVKLPETFAIKEGKIMFIDRLPSPKPRLITFENINADVSIKLDELYSKILNLSSTGEGNINGAPNERVKWAISLNPTTPKLTMSNRFEVSNADMLPFEPYYDRYSPFVFKKGRFSGTLIFDFDNGNIGSTNEIHLADIMFYIKREWENAQFWETSVQDLAKYFTSSFGDIVFDFKIKGEMSNPKFYLGPISKQALASMAIDKISTAISEAAKSKSGQAGEAGGKSDIEKAKEYIDLFQGLLKKK